jgi:hypothetical protein
MSERTEIATFGDLVREARRIGRSGDREEIDRFSARSYTHSMIMSGRVGASGADDTPKAEDIGARQGMFNRYRFQAILVAAGFIAVIVVEAGKWLLG